MPRQLVDVGDRLVGVQSPGPNGYYWKVNGHDKIVSIGVDRLPGPMGWYLVANIIFEDGKPDVIIPLHMAESFEVLNP